MKTLEQQIRELRCERMNFLKSNHAWMGSDCGFLRYCRWQQRRIKDALLRLVRKLWKQRNPGVKRQDRWWYGWYSRWNLLWSC